MTTLSGVSPPRPPSVAGSPWASFSALAATCLDRERRPFDWSGAWVLVATRAIQLKLDELIRSLDRARTQLVRLEQLSDEELAEIESEFQELRREQQD